MRDQDNTNNAKKHSRNRRTHGEKLAFSQECIRLYKLGWSPERIAYELKERVALIKEYLFDFLRAHPEEQPVQTRIYLANSNSRMKDITGTNESVTFFEVEAKSDGIWVLNPLT